MNKCSTKTLLALSLIAASSGVAAHGYVSETNDGIAGSRAALCKYPTSDTQEKTQTVVLFSGNHKVLKAMRASLNPVLLMAKLQVRVYRSFQN